MSWKEKRTLDQGQDYKDGASSEDRLPRLAH